MTVLGVDHTAIAVFDLDEAIARHARLYGAHAGQRVLLANQNVEVAFLSIGDAQIELISPTEDTSGVARFLRQRGESLHHVALLVDDLRAELQRLQAEGVELIDREPRPGVHGQVAFVHPRGTGGVLMEMVEAAAVHLE